MWSLFLAVLGVVFAVNVLLTYVAEIEEALALRVNVFEAAWADWWGGASSAFFAFCL